MMTWIVAIHVRTLYYRAFLRDIMSAIFIAVPPPPQKKDVCMLVSSASVLRVERPSSCLNVLFLRLIFKLCWLCE